MADDQPQEPRATEPEESRATDATQADASAADRDVEDTPGGMDTRMLELLVCPLTKTQLHYDPDSNELISEAAGLGYPVRGGVPILLPSEARKLRDDPVPGGAS